MADPNTDDWRRAHERGRHERTEQYIRKGLDPYAADRRAEREQTESTTRARTVLESK